MLNNAERSQIKATTKLAIQDCGGQEAATEASSRHTRPQTMSDFGLMGRMDKFIPLDTAAELDRFAENPRFARLLAKLSGHILVRLPDIAGGTTKLGKATMKALKETSEVFADLGDALADDAITPAERDKLDKSIDEAIEHLAALKIAVRANVKECDE